MNADLAGKRLHAEMPHRCTVTIVMALLALAAAPAAQLVFAAGNQAPADEEAAYMEAITNRAANIVGSLELADSAKAARVRDLVAQQYRDLREIHDARDAKIAEAEDSPAADPTIADAWIRVARDEAQLKLVALHRQFIGRLLAELTPEEVDQVKDGMTYGVVQVTYQRYLELLPSLTDEQKRGILAQLLEAREHAMDAGSSEEKHAIFRKYKGRINNYLSAAGYDLEQAEKDFAAREEGPSRPSAEQ